jgi:hypothetical protein
MTMCKFWNKNRFGSSAQVVDGNLILTLPDAINPVIWRMELGNVRTSALEVRANDNHYLLALKTPKGDVHDIAPFESRESAIHALMQVSKALGKADGKIAPQSAQQSSTPATSLPTQESQKSGNGFKWIAAFGTILILIFLFSFASRLAPKSEFLGSVTDQTSAPSGRAGEAGVPLSADQELRGF